MSKKRTSPYTISELNRRVEQYRATQENRVHKFRLKKHTTSEKKNTKTDWWDMPLTVCSSGTKIIPYIAENGRNCSALNNPNRVLYDAYHNILDNCGHRIGTISLGSKPDSVIKEKLHLTGKDSFEAGRCAEPHAVNKLLNVADTISGGVKITDLVFSVALDARYPIAKDYCVTCKCVFPQLR